MKRAQFGLNNAKTVLENVQVQYVPCKNKIKSLTFKFLAQNI